MFETGENEKDLAITMKSEHSDDSKKKVRVRFYGDEEDEHLRVCANIHTNYQLY